ncbi:hypothetical protein RZS28_01215 [Methylocapsa polymorpha]|uniref:Uncharacterized protein n=1 Tax=Methylocapsa polymorpha TaxID=3080828 RepID=A0ABZ0HTS8_9HYPH|nr:hypothetical protein RZS28_01215 [Methylocapsa sp. RX1]
MTLFLDRLPKFASILLLAGVIDGCAAPPIAPFAGPEPSDPAAQIPAASYRSTIDVFANLRPVEPGRWKGNEPAPPASKPVSEPH